MGRELGRWLIGMGVALIVVGVLAWSRALSWFGRLPGDLRIEGEHARIYIPITSMLIASLVLTALFLVFRH